MNHNTVDDFLETGCGRCALAATPACKVHQWERELPVLRKIILSTGLNEQIKWGFPCYTFKNKNVLMLVALRDYCAISFFKGVLLSDSAGNLVKPGENSQTVRQFRFVNELEIKKSKPTLIHYIEQAIQIEKSGLSVEMNAKENLKYPEELLDKFKQLPALEKAFEGLTPGRKRGYILYFSAPKKSGTRLARVEKYEHQIMSGKGMQD